MAGPGLLPDPAQGSATSMASLPVPTASVPLPPQLLSGAEDSFVHVWNLSRNLDTDDVEVSLGCGSPGWELGPGARRSGPSPPRGALRFRCTLVWLLSPLQIEHCHAECVTDTQVCGARFCDPEGNSFAVTGYDLSEIFRYSRV